MYNGKKDLLREVQSKNVDNLPESVNKFRLWPCNYDSYENVLTYN